MDLLKITVKVSVQQLMICNSTLNPAHLNTEPQILPPAHHGINSTVAVCHLLSHDCVLRVQESHLSNFTASFCLHYDCNYGDRPVREGYDHAFMFLAMQTSTLVIQA